MENVLCLNDGSWDVGSWKYIDNKMESGLRRGRSTTEPALCLKHEIRKGNVNKQSAMTYNMTRCDEKVN